MMCLLADLFSHIYHPWCFTDFVISTMVVPTPEKFKNNGICPALDVKVNEKKVGTTKSFSGKFDQLLDSTTGMIATGVKRSGNSKIGNNS
ncbi:hypothetical protein IEQ34_011673 [Dendrobium chrysotoxum]|uniref:Uncharacterized protein n=1 Tax=Dendrobium chrysotoxum TaxID=161865 RepID=A0AAV7GSY2_DENCH|nr:hypothetical protein IEQ34_011673 [Dendrobium chrysotoxum]